MKATHLIHSPNQVAASGGLRLVVFFVTLDNGARVTLCRRIDADLELEVCGIGNIGYNDGDTLTSAWEDGRRGFGRADELLRVWRKAVELDRNSRIHAAATSLKGISLEWGSMASLGFTSRGADIGA